MKEQAITEKKLFIWIPLLITVGGMVFNFAVFYTRFDRLEKDFEAHKTTQESETAQDRKNYTDIQVRLAQIQIDIQYIKEALK